MRGACGHAIFVEDREFMKSTVWIVIGVILIALVTYLVIGTNRSKEEDLTLQRASQSPQAEKASETTMSATKKTYSSAPLPLPSSQLQGKKARIKTPKGDIVFEFYMDAPLASSNFIFLTTEEFYDGLTFHRREENFVIQGGDPIGNGTGGPGYQFSDELVTRDYKRGTVAMANAGPNTNGSQFFIILKDNPLPKNYTIFGNVTIGMDVVDKIQVGDVMEKVTIE